jgi:NAD(P)-dependent dehydrogenase (short-subunit alcohol dehydrogenase family)
MKRDGLRAAHEQITNSLGAPTILVNAAGGNDPKAMVTADLKFEDIPQAIGRPSSI